MPITVMISLGITVALFLISLLFRIAARLNLTFPLLYFLAVSTILNTWAASHEKLAFAILYLLTAFSVLSWLSALRRKWQEHQYYKAVKDDMSFQISRARQRGIPLDSVHFDSQGNMRSVSYTHLDVYKRQLQYHIDLHTVGLVVRMLLLLH